MRLTRAGEYAVRCVLFLASQGENSLVNRKQIARAMEIPDQFLGKIAQQLSHAGIIEIVQGARGGLRLTRPPEQITLLEVVEAVIGEIFLNDCVMNPKSCNQSVMCPVHVIWRKAKDQLRATLREATFASLLDAGNCLTSVEKQGNFGAQAF